MHKADFRDISREQILGLAEKMKAEGRPLVVIAGYADKEGKTCIAYSYDIDGEVETYKYIGEGTIPSITGIYDIAAEWFEEEISELMGVEFSGLNKKGRLFLPEEFDGSGQIIVSSLAELRKK